MTQRTVEIFSVGCPACEETIQLVKAIACSSCDVTVLEMRTASVAVRAKTLGIRAVLAIAVNGQLVACCADRGPDETTLRAAGLGQWSGEVL
jgi:glutaredoxin 3